MIVSVTGTGLSDDFFLAFEIDQLCIFNSFKAGRIVVKQICN